MRPAHDYDGAPDNDAIAHASSLRPRWLVIAVRGVCRRSLGLMLVAPLAGSAAKAWTARSDGWREILEAVAAGWVLAFSAIALLLLLSALIATVARVVVRCQAWLVVATGDLRYELYQPSSRRET